MKIYGIKLLTLVMLFSSISVFSHAHEDDYIVGLSAFRDGLYDISAPSLETYLKGETESRKADYARYLLYRIYLESGDFKKSLNYLEKLDKAEDRRFDSASMKTDKMFLYTKTDCTAAAGYLSEVSDEISINHYLDSKCEPDGKDLELILENSLSDETKLKIVAKVSDNTELVTSVFDSLDLEKLGDNGKKYFALYFYKHGDTERFLKVRSVYEDSDVVDLEMDSLWKSDSKEDFIKSFEKNREKYSLKGVNACRAIDYYKNSGQKFDCSLVNDCFQKYSVEFVQVKGACLVKNGDPEMVTEFTDSLKSTIFPGMCGYGEYIFHNGLYTGRSHEKFYQCEERYKIADVLMNKKQYQEVVNIFFKKDKDMDRYYSASALRALGKTEAADSEAAKIDSEELRNKYKQGAQ